MSYVECARCKIRRYNVIQSECPDCFAELERQLAEAQEERDKWRKLTGEDFHNEYDLRKQLVEAQAESAVLVEALENMGALHFRKDLTEDERHERCAEIARQAERASDDAKLMLDIVEALELAQSKCTEGFSGTGYKGIEQDITVCTLCSHAETDMDGHADDCPFAALAAWEKRNG